MRPNKKLLLKDEMYLMLSSHCYVTAAKSHSNATSREQKAGRRREAGRREAQQTCRDKLRCLERILSPSHSSRFIFPPVKFFMRRRWLCSMAMPTVQTWQSSSTVELLKLLPPKRVQHDWPHQRGWGRRERFPREEISQARLSSTPVSEECTLMLRNSRHV